MNCHMRMSLIVLLLLWSLCRGGTSSYNEGRVNDTVVQGANVSVPGISANLQLTTPTTTQAREHSIKSTSRSKLWSPYSTLINLVEENEEEGSVVTAHPTFSVKSESRGKGGSDETQVADESPTPRKFPVISSIRHYRSRKSFVRTKKVAENKRVQSDEPLTKRHEDVTDLEQGDEPNGAHSSEEQHKEFKYGKVVEEQVRDNGQSSPISLESDMDKAYGTPFFISTTREAANSSSTKPQKKGGLSLLQKHVLANTSRNGSVSDYSVPASSHKLKNESKSKSSEREFGRRKPQQRPNDKFSTKGSSTSVKEGKQQQQILQTTKKPRGGGKKLRDKIETRKSHYANGSQGTDDIFPVILSSPPRPSRVDRQKMRVDSQSGSLKKVKEKESSHHHTDTQDNVDNKFNYNSDYVASNDHHPSHDPQNEDTDKITDFRGESDGDGDDGMLEFFPKVEWEAERDDGSGGGSDIDDYGKWNPVTTKSPGHIDVVTRFLTIVEEQSALGANCTRGTDFNLGEGVVDRYAHERFRLEAELTVNRANMLTRFWKYASPLSHQDEYLLHAMVMSLVEFDEDIFAGGNCYDENQFKNYTLFCPFAYRERDGSILVKDLSLEYPYLSNTSEWFYKARKVAEGIIKENTQFTRGFHNFRRNNESNLLEEDLLGEKKVNLTEDEILNVTYDDGKWSKPYFDCGGGNIWMITYTIPFFGYNGTYYFKGTSGIDIDLRRVDIDQCPLPKNSTELNIFAASDKCKKSTTKCVPIKGLGFRRGSYRCECRKGFYFPNVTSQFKHFNGTLLEEEYEKKFTGQNESSVYDMEGLFECLPCPYGCDTCMDDRPCVVSLNWLMRTAILILQGAIILMLPIVGLFTWKYSNVKVVRAASPVLLRFIVLGAFFIYCTILVMYPSPSVVTCTIRIWLREIGFSLAYGALMLKTWRISVIFRVRSAKAIKITDLDLMKRLGIIVAVFTSLLVIRTLVAPPVAIVSYTADELKAWLCKSDWWDHSFTIMELCFLVWGIRLCIVVRKAPSEFNESKFISLAIYNEFLLSLFLNISMLFLQSPANPDLLYIIFFCHVQLTMTLLLCLIFGSKAYIVFRGQGKGGSDETRMPTSKFISKSRSGQTTKQTSAHNSTGGLHSSTTSTSHDPNLNSRLSEDVQEEFRNLYFQLEELKERNMRLGNQGLGNRHLVAKIKAMQEAADTIFCTSAQINGQNTGMEVSPNSKGKSVVLSDISEEDNSPLPQSILQTPKPKATGIASEKVSFFSGNSESEGDNRSKEEKDGQLEDVGDGNQEEGLPPQEAIRTKKADKVHFGDLELQDTNLDEVESDDEPGITLDLAEEKKEEGKRSDIKSDCINDKEDDATAEGENIPMQVLRKRKHKQPQDSSTNPTSSQSGFNSSEIGKQQKSGEEKPQNNAKTKLVLDLDDKSRFTDEITV